jgi:hypothetical protein
MPVECDSLQEQVTGLQEGPRILLALVEKLSIRNIAGYDELVLMQ